ncbi:glycine zipper domain-containing protein [Arthrobacter cupressi]|uniref:Glycine zipper n=1 Tax=Arthrobacter cupressi TaxID=1045773 RepID=A0A1G8RSG4_9MICC|nr:glycine zipper domain-containing protein [Arthrobacter cupressi]NYD79288.1 putative membrane protein YfcA [Arthrobacter cupressi]SDJ19310.1 Glycine zipper [Arthrobacter cupressi]
MARKPPGNPSGSRPDRKRPHRNGRGLFVGAVIGAVAGFFVGRNLGNPVFGTLIGAVIVAALMYRINPGPWKRD